MSELSAAARIESPPAASAQPRRRTRNVSAYLWILPALFVVALFTVYPVAYSVDLALHRNVLTRPNAHPFVGLENFTDVLSDASLQRSVVTTLRFTVLSVVGTAVLGILIAQLMNERFAGAKVLHVLVLIPWAVPPVMAGIVWLWMFRGDVGIINGALYSLGLIDTYQSFLADQSGATLAVWIARLWKDVPLAAILTLATLQVIPAELYDACKIDGGGAWERFRFVTFPFLRPTLMVVLILETITAFVTFDLVAVMTGGGPADATRYIAWFTYQEIFTDGNLGTGAALAFVIAAVTLVIAVVYFYALRSRAIYSE